MIATVEQRGDDAQTLPPSVAVVDIGNTSIATGLWNGECVIDTSSAATGTLPQTCAVLETFASRAHDGYLSDLVIASVVPQACDDLCQWVRTHLKLEPLVISRQVPLPIDVLLDEPNTVGVDRICSAAAAFHVRKEACVVVDFGTAVTIDLVDDNGAFLGGTILPGLGMQAHALHKQTAALPYVEVRAPEQPIGKCTGEAILSGIVNGTAGAVRGIVELFAMEIGRWPPSVATGGDAGLMAERCGVFDAILPDLCLTGVGLAYARRLDRAVVL